MLTNVIAGLIPVASVDPIIELKRRNVPRPNRENPRRLRQLKRERNCISRGRIILQKGSTVEGSFQIIVQEAPIVTYLDGTERSDCERIQR